MATEKEPSIPIKRTKDTPLSSILASGEFSEEEKAADSAAMSGGQPYAINQPHQEENGNVTPKNYVLDRNSSPVYAGYLPQNHCVLVTAWLWWLTIKVVDLNRQPIGAFYNGKDVYEKVQGSSTFLKINQTIQNASYTDPVGVFIYNNGTTTPQLYDRGKAADRAIIAAWPTAATLPMGPAAGVNITQNLAIKVDEQVLYAIWQGDPNPAPTQPAIQGRTVLGTAPNNVKITWPNSPPP